MTTSLTVQVTYSTSDFYVCKVIALEPDSDTCVEGTALDCEESPCARVIDNGQATTLELTNGVSVAQTLYIDQVEWHPDVCDQYYTYSHSVEPVADASDTYVIATTNSEATEWAIHDRAITLRGRDATLRTRLYRDTTALIDSKTYTVSYTNPCESTSFVTTSYTFTLALGGSDVTVINLDEEYPDTASQSYGNLDGYSFCADARVYNLGNSNYDLTDSNGILTIDGDAKTLTATNNPSLSSDLSYSMRLY